MMIWRRTRRWALVSLRRCKMGRKGKKSRLAFGWIERKQIKGHWYLYLRWYDGKKKRSAYLGKLPPPRAAR